MYPYKTLNISCIVLKFFSSLMKVPVNLYLLTALHRMKKEKDGFDILKELAEIIHDICHLHNIMLQCFKGQA